MSDISKPHRLTGFYTTKSGYRSFTLDDATVERLRNLETGSQLWLYTNQRKEKDTQPDYNLVFYTSEQVEARRRQSAAQRPADASASAKPQRKAKSPIHVEEEDSGI